MHEAERLKDFKGAVDNYVCPARLHLLKRNRLAGLGGKPRPAWVLANR
jgi:hypothetical protein